MLSCFSKSCSGGYSNCISCPIPFFRAEKRRACSVQEKDEDTLEKAKESFKFLYPNLTRGKERMGGKKRKKKVYPFLPFFITSNKVDPTLSELREVCRKKSMWEYINALSSRENGDIFWYTRYILFSISCYKYYACVWSSNGYIIIVEFRTKILTTEFWLKFKF